MVVLIIETGLAIGFAVPVPVAKVAGIVAVVGGFDGGYFPSFLRSIMMNSLTINYAIECDFKIIKLILPKQT